MLYILKSIDGANPDEIEGEGESSGSNPESPHKKQRKESSGSSDLASPITAPAAQHYGMPPFTCTTTETTTHSLTMEVKTKFIILNLHYFMYGLHPLIERNVLNLMCLQVLPNGITQQFHQFITPSTPQGVALINYSDV